MSAMGFMLMIIKFFYLHYSVIRKDPKSRCVEFELTTKIMLMKLARFTRIRIVNYSFTYKCFNLQFS